MIHHPYITGALLGIAVLLAFLCSIGLLVMRDPYQRMQFSTPIVSIPILLITIAIWIEDGEWQARIKSALIALILFLMNAVLSHATTRAIRIREVGRLEICAEEAIPTVDENGKALAGPGER